MNFRHSFLVVVVSCLPALVLLIRGIGWGNDSFAFYAAFPQFNFVTITFFMLIAYLFALLSLWILGNRVLGCDGWLLPVYVGTLTPLFFIEGMRFENDLFGWSLALVALAVFSLAIDAKKWLKVPLLTFFIILGGISCIVWQASIVLLPIALLLLPIKVKYKQVLIILIFFAFFFLQWNYIVHSFDLTTWVSEEIPLLGLVFVLHLLHFWKKIPQPFTIYGIGLLVMGAIKAKYMFLATPFLLMALIKKEKSGGLFFGKTRLKLHVPLFCVVFAVGLIFMDVTAYPQQSDLDEMRTLIQTSHDTNVPLYNEWDSGWIFEYLGFDTSYKMYYPNPDWNKLSKPFLAYSTKDLDINCSKISKNSYLCS